VRGLVCSGQCYLIEQLVLLFYLKKLLGLLEPRPCCGCGPVVFRVQCVWAVSLCVLAVSWRQGYAVAWARA
jgi:hypothetical protein